ncbi:1282_t:CDS:2 [Racocetra fulgida]|uniref:1282_t:CDS:1 n=1 Tax=Racocetra fulgida TaxID=60492 RepID=A0A9N9G9J6_9GLOM|nr:1282_t:CDS:2 [Racocetra fulgida]
MNETDNFQEAVPTDIQSLKASMIKCTETLSDCMKIKTDDIIVKDKMKEIIKVRLEFQDFAEMSVDHCTKLSGYIVDLEGVVDLVNDKTICVEDFIDMIKSLSDETKDYEAISQDLLGQIKSFLDKFFHINADFKSYMNEIKEAIDEMNLELKDAENKKQKLEELYNKFKPKLWERALNIGATALGVAIAPELALAFVITYIISEYCRYDRTDLLDVAAELVKYQQNSIEKKTGDFNDLQVLTKAIADIALSFTTFKIFWDKQRETLSRILKNLNTASKENRVNKLKVKLIGKQLDKLKSSISDYNYTISKILTHDKMIN